MNDAVAIADMSWLDNADAMLRSPTSSGRARFVPGFLLLLGRIGGGQNAVYMKTAAEK
jgi:hypothetical protein